MGYNLTYQRFSERSILVEWPSDINENILRDVLGFKNRLEHSNIKEIVQVNSAYSSLLVIYVSTIDNVYDEIKRLKVEYSSRDCLDRPVFKFWEIPVCYDKEFGIDLEEISEEKNCSISQIIQLHSQPIYTVYFVGFLPGFLYLGGLDKGLHFPRKVSPRLQIKKGAVAIGGAQTGIYPNASPGGWNIIGNSPLEFFNPNHDIPCFAKAGDNIKFIPVDRDVYNQILMDVQNGRYHIKSQDVYD
ncbi:5-oxoprolinase subunit PxpB [Psychroserpens algicola]|uniref:5-oxoprolinase subunit PxpB n=1 Tax=Psychroserpens algicola TaxID=1719034 RepID=A0ABT0HA27_9FLAO|nr:5-oxoprolinase subunit PxpB [Psychroserpens algicola]MCK8481211.1 5-oxoprolinase subunit PxpB [Psychroserpens algicola]